MKTKWLYIILYLFRYFATLLRNANDFEEGEFSENPRNRKIFFEISITKGDREKVNCLASAHKVLGGLSPKKVKC